MSYLSSFPGEINLMGVLLAEPTRAAPLRDDRRLVERVGAMNAEFGNQPRKPGAQAA